MAQLEYVKSLGATYIRSATFIKEFTGTYAIVHAIWTPPHPLFFP